jgi:hypothetical protein
VPDAGIKRDKADDQQHRASKADPGTSATDRAGSLRQIRKGESLHRAKTAGQSRQQQQQTADSATTGQLRQQTADQPTAAADTVMTT